MGKRKGRRPTKPLSLPKKIFVYGGYVFMASLFIIAFVTGVGPYDIPPQARAMEDAIAESKRLGLPMTQEDLKPESIPPNGDNSAPDFLSIAEQLPDFYFQLDAIDPEKAVAEQERLEDELSEFDDDLDELVQILENKKDWYVERDFDLGPHLLLPEYATCKAAARWLSARSKSSAQRGDYASAVSDIGAIMTLSEHLSKEPLVLALLVSVAIDAIASRAIELVADFAVNDAKTLGELDSLIVKWGAPADPRPALRGDFYLMLGVARNIDLYGGKRALFSQDLMGQASMSHYEPPEPPETPDSSKIKRNGLPKKMVYKAQLTTASQLYNELFQYLGESGEKSGWGYKSYEISIELEESWKLSGFLLFQVLPAYGQVEFILQKQDAFMATNLAMLRILKFRSEHGRLPVDLEEAGAGLIDPFSPNQNLKYIFAPDEVRAWSVGLDTIDQNGLPRNSTIGPDFSDDIASYWPAIRREQLRP